MICDSSRASGTKCGSNRPAGGNDEEAVRVSNSDGAIGRFNRAHQKGFLPVKGRHHAGDFYFFPLGRRERMRTAQYEHADLAVYGALSAVDTIKCPPNTFPGAGLVTRLSTVPSRVTSFAAS